MTSGIAPDVILDARDVWKSYSGVAVVRACNLRLPARSLHAVVGENGAGKSTLMKVICGVVAPDRGEIIVDGAPLGPGRAAARRAGLSMVHQELSLVPTLSIAENCVLGDYPTRAGVVQRRAMRTAGAKALELVGLDRDPLAPVSRLSFAERQLVEIGRCLLGQPRVLVLDEPTSALSPGETSRLFELLRRLRASAGTAIVYVSHRMDEIYELCETATVMRDGQVVANYNLSEVPSDRLVRAMVGRELDLLARREPVSLDEASTPVIETHDLYGPGVRGVSLSIRAGEILGLGGLAGAGRTEFARLLAGLARPTAGSIVIRGRRVTVRTPRRARDLGIAFVPEDRQQEGLALELSSAQNAVVPSLKSLSHLGVLRRRRVTASAKDVLVRSGVRPANPKMKAAYLSGGNQQKIVIGKWLPTNPQLLILDEPTRGVDVQARSEIHRRIDELARERAAILLISSDLPELLALADRIAVIRDGCVVGRVERDNWTEERVISLAAGGGATA